MTARRRKIFNVDRFPSTRFALRVATYTTLGLMASFGSCALLVGGMHGMVIASVLSGLLGAGLGVLGIAAGAVTDGTRAVGEALDLWRPVVTAEVEADVGQLSLGATGAPGEVSVADAERGEEPL